MTTFTEGTHAGEFIVSEANGNRSREKITVLSGQNLKAGAVVGRTMVGATAASVANAGNTGNGVMGAITVTGPAVKPGVYKLSVIEPGANAGTFRVEDPDGVEIGTGVVATLFNKGGLSFTLADGATDFIAGDGFALTVTPGTLRWKEYNPANSDGSQFAAGVLYDAVDATGGDKPGVAIVRDAEVRDSDLQWFSGANAGQKTVGKQDLATSGIIARA